MACFYIVKTGMVYLTSRVRTYFHSEDMLCVCVCVCVCVCARAHSQDFCHVPSEEAVEL